MIEFDVYNRQGEVVGRVAIDEADFGGEVRLRLLREAVLMYENSRRVGTANTRTRSEVRASHAKPYRQKGTGRARAGFRRSPIWRGGGIVFGPKPRSYRYRMPRKALRVATKSAYLAKFQGATTVIDELHVERPRTREVAAVLAALGIDRGCLIAIEDRDANLWKSARNLPRVAMKPVAEINAYDLLHRQRLLITRAALEKLVASVGGTLQPAAAEAPQAADEPPAAPQAPAAQEPRATEQEPAAAEAPPAEAPAAEGPLVSTPVGDEPPGADDEPAAAPEPPADQEEPAAAEEPTAPEPARVDESLLAPEPLVSDDELAEPLAPETPEPLVAADEPQALDEPEAADEPAQPNAAAPDPSE